MAKQKKNKVCSKCDIEKSLDSFYKDSTKKDGYRCECCSCRKLYNKEHKAEIKLYRDKYNKTYYQKNREKAITYSNQYRKNNEQKVKESSKKSYLKTINTRKIYLINNKQKIKKQQSEWYYLIKDTKHYRNIIKARNTKRRHLEKNAGNFTAQDWKEVLEKHGEYCLHCGSVEHITVDHVVPLSKGGSNTKDNLQPLCLSCNCSKGTKTMDYRI